MILARNELLRVMPLSVLSVQKVWSSSGRVKRRWSMYSPTKRAFPTRPEPDNTFWTDSTDAQTSNC